MIIQIEVHKATGMFTLRRNGKFSQIAHVASSVFFSHQSYSIALRHINAIIFLANLHYMKDDSVALIARFDRYSPTMRGNSKNYLASLTLVSVGGGQLVRRWSSY